MLIKMSTIFNFYLKQTAPLLQKSSKGEGVEKGVIGKLVGASYQNPTPLEKIEIVKTVTS